MILIKDMTEDPYPHVLVISKTYASVREMVPIDAPTPEVEEGEDASEPESLEERIRAAVAVARAKELELSEARQIVKKVKVEDKV